MGKAITWNEQQVEKILGEVMDKDKTLLSCQKHRYIASNTPPMPVGCKDCWLAYYWYMIATTPPHLREERLGQLERALTDAVAMAERGEFDFEPMAHPEIVTEKDAFDEKSRTYKPPQN